MTSSEAVAMTARKRKRRKRNLRLMSMSLLYWNMHSMRLAGMVKLFSL